MGDPMKEKVGILGGTFDPVHQGHLGLVCEVRKIFHLNRVLFIPACQSPHKKDGPSVSADHRMAMLRLAVESEPAFEVSDLELQKKGISYTVDTLDALGKIHAVTEFYLIMGVDTCREIDSWKDVRHLISMCNIIVGTRPGHNAKRPLEIVADLFGEESTPYLAGKNENGIWVFLHRETGRKMIFFDLTPKEISSSEIRYRLGKNKAIKNMLPPEVEHYIMKNRLYLTESFP